MKSAFFQHVRSRSLARWLWTGGMGSLVALGLVWSPVALAADLFHSPGDTGAPAAGVPTLAGSPEERVYLYLDAGGGGLECRHALPGWRGR
ncbi:MAG: hypothetical protein P8Q97_12735 [Myxococcota bacterium]|nr:hypothetical protein [Myxococcota bacterium]